MPTPKTRLSRREKLKRSPVPWIIMLVISLFIFLFFIKNGISEWTTKRETITNLSTKNIETEKEIDLLAADVEDLKAEFDKKAEEQKNKESLIFPEQIDVRKLVQVLEIFSLQLFNITETNQNSVFELESLSVSAPTADQDQEGAQKTQVTFSITTDQQNLETLIEYLQTNEIPKRMLDAQKRGRLDDWDFKIIEGNPLPIMLIESITKSDTDNGLIKANLTCSFYSQPSTNESGN